MAETAFRKVKIPEVDLYNIINALLDEVKRDYDTQASVTDTYLYRMLNTVQDSDKYKYLDQAVALFVNRESDNPRKVSCRMFYDTQRAGLPTIHITMPSDSMGENALSVDEDPDEHWINSTTGEISPMYSRRFDTQFHIICTSDNNREALLMYHVVRAMIISAIDSLSLIGLENIKMSGQELKLTDHNAPIHLFSRGIGLLMSYEVSVPKMFSQAVYECFTIGSGTIIDK